MDGTAVDAAPTGAQKHGREANSATDGVSIAAANFQLGQLPAGMRHCRVPWDTVPDRHFVDFWLSTIALMNWLPQLLTYLSHVNDP